MRRPQRGAEFTEIIREDLFLITVVVYKKQNEI